ncbi:MAG TPA: winged helix DNA-binding domain-containing protein [Acidimicrobiales bacterium]
MTDEVLGDRALGRATLARQILLEREDRDLTAAVDHLVGLQAQVPHNPYNALWSRLDPFDPEALSRLLEDRVLVRIVTLRGTLHLVTADDCLLLRPLVQPVLEGELARHQTFAPRLAGVDLDLIMAVARPQLDERPFTGPQLRAFMAEHFPEHDAAALAFACRNRLALVQVPPRGLWGRGGQVTTMTAEGWLGRPLVAEPSIDAVVLRYIAAFGPSTVADVATWSRLTAFREVLDRLRPQLRTFRDERGRELFDLPDAPRPDPDTPAPVRFLPEYDNVLLSHADRSRFARPEHREEIGLAFDRGRGSMLADGILRGAWSLEHDAKARDAVLTVRAVGRLSARETSAIEAEGMRLLGFLAPDARPEVRVVGADGGARVARTIKTQGHTRGPTAGPGAAASGEGTVLSATYDNESGAGAT